MLSSSRHLFQFRAFSASTFYRHFASFKHYPVPPQRQEYIDGYLKDFRTDRQLIETVNYKTKNGEKKQLRIEVLDDKDIPLMGQMVCDHFMKNVSILSQLKGTYDDFAQFYYDDIGPKLHEKISLLVKDKDKVIGFNVSYCIKKQDFGKYFTNGSHMKNPVLEIKDDYGEDIRNGPYKSYKANQLLTVLDAPSQQILRFLPPDVKHILYYEAVGIGNEHQNLGIFPVLMKLTLKVGKEKGCNYAIIECVGKEMADITKRYWDFAFIFPYNKFKDNGKLVYENLPCGAEASLRFASSSTIKHYPVPPRQKYIDGYLKDVRTDRPLVETLNYKTKNGEKKQLRIEVLDEKDIPLMGQMVCDHFMKNISIVSHLNGTYDDFAQFYYDDIAPKLSAKVSMIVKDEDKAIGFNIFDCIKKEDFGKYFPNGSYMENPVLEIKDDYGEDIKNGPYRSHKANQLLTVLDTPMSQTLRFLPPDVKHILYYEAVGIGKEYQNCGIFRVLIECLLQFGKDKGCDYVIAECVGKETAEIAKKYWNVAFTFPYDKFKDNGKLVYENLPCGAEGVVLGYKKI